MVRFLQLQHRTAERDQGDGDFVPVDELVAGDAVVAHLGRGGRVRDVVRPVRHRRTGDARRRLPLAVAGGTDIEAVDGGRLVRTRCDLRGELTLSAEPDDGLLRISLAVRNTGAPVADKDDAIATSLIGTHLIAEVSERRVRLAARTAPAAVDAVARCRQHRCFPVLAGPPGERDLVLISPIILYDHPEIAEQSDGALFDSTEIDEILTLRVMTMTDEEKAQARATDPLAAQIIDRCDSMSPEAMLNLHGVLRDPHTATADAGLIPEIPEGVDWWDPMADNACTSRYRRGAGQRCSGDARQPGPAAAVPARRRPGPVLRRRVARVTSVHEDVDGDQHVGVVIEDDPAADLHDWYGRYLYFAPDEVEPLSERNPTWKQ